MKRQQMKKIFRRFYINTLVLVLCHLSFAVWAAPTVVVTVTEGVPLTIDFSSTLGGFTNPVVSISQDPSLGTAQVTSNTTVVYTPNVGATGTDSFVYLVSSDLLPDETGDVIITVGSAADQGNTALEALEHTLTSTCSLAQRPDNVCNIWDAIQNLTEEDKRAFLLEMSPEQIAAQLQLSNTLLRDQVSSISKRLAAIRKAMKHATGGQLTFVNDAPYSTALLDGDSGGAASADPVSTGKRLSWYVDNSNRFGGQDDTEREEGYDFSTQTLNLGVDLTLGYAGVIGTAFGYGKTDLELDFDGGNLVSNGISNAIYGSFYMTPNTYLEIVMNNAYYELSSKRKVVWGATIDDIVESDTNAWMNALNVSFGAEKNWGKLTLSIDNTLSYLKSTIEGYTETSSTASNPFVFSIDERVSELAKYSLTVRSSYAAGFSWGIWNHQFDLIYNRLHKKEGETISASLAAAPDATFKFSADKEDQSFAQIGYGGNFIFPGGTMFYLRLETTLARDNYVDLGTGMGLRMEF